jgi:hypothetical protein
MAKKLTSSEGGAEETDGKFDPHKKHESSKHNAYSYLSGVSFHPIDYQLSSNADTRQQYANDNEIGETPFHFIGEEHRNKWHEQH